MAYKIIYEKTQATRIRLPNTKIDTRKTKWVFAMIIFGVILFGLSSAKVRSYILPGDPKITEKALCDLTDDLKAGETFSDAITTFCRVILDNA